jgi:acyl-CoA synthetase (AMP-forming)/AMP-acid ligase II
MPDAEARLLEPGSPFELRDELVLGERMRVFAQRPKELRAVLADSERLGDAEYLVFPHLRLGYRQHVRAVASVARGLQQRYRVGKGDRVAILAANCPEWIVGFWAAITLGAIPVGLNAWWAGDEIRHALEDCAPRVLIADGKRFLRVPKLDIPVVRIEDDFPALLAFAPDAPLSSTPIAEDDPAAILYTSGTTGRCKGVVASHRNVIALSSVQMFHGARMHLAAPPQVAPAPTQRCMLVGNPLFHVSGLYTQVVTGMRAGAKTVWTTGKFDPGIVLRLIAEEKVTGWSPHGPMAPRLLRHPDRGKYDLSSVLNLGSGGAPIPPALITELAAAFPNARSSLTVGYGLTECTALASINWGAELLAHPTSVGRPLPTVEIEIRGPDGARLPDGEEGEICVRSPLVMLGYFRRSEATGEAIGSGRWLRTGDLGRLRSGRLYIEARRRDLILRGAENVYPIEIERRLEAHPEVLEAAVVGVPHPELGQEVKAFIVPRDGTAPDPGVLSRWVSDALAYFKVPAHWEIRNAPLPRNASGKVMKQDLAG